MENEKSLTLTQRVGYLIGQARRLHPLPRQLDRIENQLKGVENRLNRVESHLSGLAIQVGALANQISLLQNQVSIISRAVQRVQGQPLEDAAHRIAMMAGIHASGRVASQTRSSTQAAPDLLPNRAFDEAAALQKLSELLPRIFPIWLRLYENDAVYYQENIEASISHWGNKYARLFNAYMLSYASGPLLDVYRINGLPSYLAGYPKTLIVRLDPRLMVVDGGFAQVRGFNEFLPWDDATFGTVVSGTSLDHVLSLETSFDEVRRVLKPGGVYLVWLASIAGAKPYTPDAPDYAPADRFHLFHFDRTWIEPMFARWFTVEDVVVIPQEGFDHVFYALRKPPE